MNIILSKISESALYSFIAFLIFLVYLAIEFFLLKKRNGFSMDPGPLTHQYLFWASIRIPLLSFIYFGVFSWSSSSFKFDHVGFNSFIEISKLPLGLLSLSIPFVAIVNNIHRTVQTDEQIKKTKKKNKIDEFYAHQKNHIEYFSSVINGTLTFNIEGKTSHPAYGIKGTFSTEEIKTFKVESPFKLYKRTFNLASTDSNDFSISPFLIHRVQDKWQSIDENILLLKTITDDFDYFRVASTIELYLKLIASELFLTPYPTKNTYTVETKRFKYSTAFENEDEFKFALRLYLKLTREYLDIIKVDDIPNAIHQRIATYTYSSDYILPMEEGWAFIKTSGDTTGFESRKQGPQTVHS